MLELKLYADYSRQDVHDIVSPDTRFVPNAGSWGLQGIVRVPNQSGDYIFFVTYGQQQGDHTFDEWITEEGIISWQSQPRQTLQDRRINEFINHNENRNSIFLFLRTRKPGNYTYLGTLKYVSHNPQAEQPVYMYWRLLNWPIPQEVLSRINLTLLPKAVIQNEIAKVNENRLGFHNGEQTFRWKNKEWKVNRQAVVSHIMELASRSFPEEAIRFIDWYIEIEGLRVSPKWIFHLITGAGYNEFDSPTAREKLLKIGLVSKKTQSKDELESTDALLGNLLDLRNLKSGERLEFFQKISEQLSKDYAQILGGAEYRYPFRKNWFEIHIPNLKGYYFLRLGRRFIEIGYIFSGNVQAIDSFMTYISPSVHILSEVVKRSVTVVSDDLKTWGRLSYNLQESSIVGSDNLGLGPIAIDFAKQFGIFIKETLNKLISILHTGIKKKIIEKHSPVTGPQVHILAYNSKVESINRVLEGVNSLPTDEILCDWVQFCYDFGLYKEGQELFSLITPDQVNDWYYDRTKKLPVFVL